MNNKKLYLLLAFSLLSAGISKSEGESAEPKDGQEQAQPKVFFNAEETLVFDEDTINKTSSVKQAQKEDPICHCNCNKFNELNNKAKKEYRLFLGLIKEEGFTLDAQ